MARIDYLNDPDAPRANSLVPAVSAIVTDEARRIRLILRTDNGYWSIPGGGVKPGESVKDAVAREVKEETGKVHQLKIHPSSRLRIRHHYERRAEPYIG